MDSLMLPNILDDLFKFHTSGKFADFEICCHGYVFQVHKVIICASSKFFQTLCGGCFREATENSVSLDDDPIMLARLIQMCYTGDYGNTKSENVFTVMLENALFLGRMRGLASPNNLQNDSGDCVLHAKMYALSDKYDVGRARVLAAAKLRARVCAEDIKSDEVLAAAKIIYSMTPQSDDVLRKHVVYYAQRNMLEILKKPAFQELMADPDFAWDFGTKYASRAHVWCLKCFAWTDISVVCGCGFNQLCDASEACKTQDWALLKCAGCKQQGKLLRDEPKEDDDTASDGSALITPPPTPKKRKH